MKHYLCQKSENIIYILVFSCFNRCDSSHTQVPDWKERSTENCIESYCVSHYIDRINVLFFLSGYFVSIVLTKDGPYFAVLFMDRRGIVEYFIPFYMG